MKQIKLIAALALALLALHLQAQGIPEKKIEYKPIAYKPITNVVALAYKPLPGALPTNIVTIVRRTGQGGSQYGFESEGYSFPGDSNYSYRYRTPYTSGYGGSWGNGTYGGWYFNQHNSSRPGL